MLSVGLVTIYLVIYLTLLQFETTKAYGFVMLLFAPLLLCWMVYTILKYGRYDGPDLGNEEFGYQDKSNDPLGVL
jgi:hypothetical protein